MSAANLDPPVIVIDTIEDEVPTDAAGVDGEVSSITAVSDVNVKDRTNSDVTLQVPDIQVQHETVPNDKTKVKDKIGNKLLSIETPTNNYLTKSSSIDSISSAASGRSDPVVTIHGLSKPSVTGPNGSHAHRHRHSSQDEDLKHLTKDDLLLAETLIKDAETGRNFVYKTEPVYVRFYILYHKWYLQWTLYVFILANLGLAFMEKPTVADWEQPYWATMILEAFCLLFFITRVVHSSYFSLPNIFWRDTKNIIVIGVIVLTILDMICYIIWMNAAPDTHPVRWSRPLRALLIINFSDGRQIRRAFRNIRRTVPEIMNVLILFFMSVLLFALLAVKLFGRRKNLKYYDGSAYFKRYFDSIWDLYVLVTTANNPDVMMPAYDENKWFALFFVVYVIICLYVFMSIVLAAIYNNYRSNLKNEIKMAVFGKRKKLRQAFAILKVTTRTGSDIISRTVWNTIMSRVLPGKSMGQIELLMTILDSEKTGSISKDNFLNLTNLLQVPVSEVRDRQTFLERRIPDIYNSRASTILKACVRHKVFRYFFDFMIFVNAWFIGFDVDQSDWAFLSIFMIEIIFKMYVFGPKEFFKRFWNTFDFFVIVSAVIATAVESASGEKSEELSTLDLLLVLRVLRLVKIFGSIKRFKVILMTIVNIGPSISTYGGVIFVLYYMFAIIGMEIFHGLVRYYGYNETNISEKFCGNPALNGTMFYRSHYCNNNFNDIRRSFVVLFELTVVNQWHVLSSGFVFVTNKWARLYFFTFHLCCVVIVLNIFVAFILEAFILEYSLQKTGRLESVVEAKIKELGLGIGQKPQKNVLGTAPEVDKLELVPNEQEMGRSSPPPGEPAESDSDTDSIPDLSNERGVRFHLKKKSRKKVETLLMQMFEGEIDPEEEEKDEQFVFKVRSVTLDSIT